jgi:hypothetical protein
VGAVKIVSTPEADAFIRERGGKLWVWLDPHGGLGGPAVIYLIAATEPPGASKATRRLRSARRPHRFHATQGDGYEVKFDHGKFDAPQELHLVLKRFPKRRIDAFWDGKIFVDADLPEER